MAKKTTINNSNTATIANAIVNQKKKIETVEQKKLTTEKEHEKITVAPAAKKITTAKAAEKIATQPEPIKIATVPDEKSVFEKKKIIKTSKAKEKALTKEGTKTATTKTVGNTPKTKTKKIKETKEKVEKKKEATKKETTKTTAKKQTIKKAITKEKTNPYLTYDLGTCIMNMQAMGIGYAYEDYARILLDEADMKNIENNIIEGNDLKQGGFTFEKHGYDTSLIAITLKKVADTMDIKAADFKGIKKEIVASLKVKLVDDGPKNAEEYLKEFRLCEKLLMIGQRKNITSAQDISNLIGTDIDTFIGHFFTFAYGILPTWKYEDVQYYEDFAYAILTQFVDLYQKYQLHVLIDCADLYILHGDYQHGDENYGYIIRDNQIKDYIYYRFASVYEAIDMNKAKALAHEALNFVEEQFVYYKNIMDIIHK